ncbi:BZ3500_MvSof-1268-A1-R1_Chr1-1g00932 [Microbotryum saponariae]|uniref:BZ3500_MvSof-1268-A1-R1_Chr1-1g00932 protein n=1 Tax=Microbotryum saponariae TaxID=289078 RepID=A0A2X0KJM8_9BASI|nr:BZ3500_MvSof-1268-A1-R1_Chr1-1g00932 [Microbotryum saponariae]SCZ92967.1 BZ3501_MvSof-1269-A2-R1_Chr1-1g00529 [Microbotryum saponariae]
MPPPSASTTTSHPSSHSTGVSIRLAEPYVLLVGGPELERARARRRRALRQAPTPTSAQASPSPSRTPSRAASPSHELGAVPGPGPSSTRGRTGGPRNGDPDFIAPNARGRSSTRTRSPSVARAASLSRALAQARVASTSRPPPTVAVNGQEGEAAAAEHDDEPAPAMLRGLLVLHLAKATRIREISVRLRGLARTDWPEGIGPRKMEIMEESTLTNITSTFFSANETSMERRAASIGPGTGDYGSDTRFFEAGRGRSSRRAASVRPSRDLSQARPYGTRDGSTGSNHADSAATAGLGNLEEETTVGIPVSTLSRIASSEDLESRDRHDIPPILPGEQAPAYELVPSLPNSPALRPTRSLGRDSPTPDSRRLLGDSRRPERSPTPSRSSLGMTSHTNDTPDARPSLDRASTSSSALSQQSILAAQQSHSPHLYDTGMTSSHSASSCDVSSTSEVDTIHGPDGWSSAPVLGSVHSIGERGRPTTRSGRQSEDEAAVASEITLPGVPSERSDLGGTARSGSVGPTFQSRASTRQSPPTIAAAARSRTRSGSVSGNSLRRTISGVSAATPNTLAHSSLPPSPSGIASAFRNLSVGGAPRSSSRGGAPPRSSSRGGRFSLAGIGEALRGKSTSRVRDSSNVRNEMGVRGDSMSSSRRETSPDSSQPATGIITRDQSRGRKTALKVLRAALTAGGGGFHEGDGGVEGDNDNSDDEVQATGWKEFRAGTYTYPISIAIPVRLPPTISASFGHVTYVLKATVHRAGALTSNLTTSTEIVLVSAPSQDDTEENESIVVERFWETQMKYNVALSGKSFAIGSQIPVSIRLDPMAKIKVYRITAVLEQKTNYFASGRKLTRHETPKKFPLLRIEHKDPKEPLLPILSDDPKAITDHPLAGFFINPDTSDDTTPALLDPLGPWHIESYLQLPTCASKIAFSTHHEQSNIATSHIIKVMLRVERGDDEYLDSKGNRKLWDVIIESPIHILACQCAQNILPAYSAALGGGTRGQNGGPVVGGTVQPCEVHSPPSTIGGPISSNGRRPPSTTRTDRSRSRVRTAAIVAAAAVAAAASPYPHRSESPHPSIPANELEETNALFARLVAGEEMPSGEVPPTYGATMEGEDEEEEEAEEEGRGRTPVGRGRTRTRDHSVEA